MGGALLMEKHPPVSSENYNIRMQCHLCNSFDSMGLKKKVNQISYDPILKSSLLKSVAIFYPTEKKY